MPVTMTARNHYRMDASTVPRSNHRTSTSVAAAPRLKTRAGRNIAALSLSFVSLAFLTYATGADRPAAAAITWSSWRLAPPLAFILLLVAALYANGMRRRPSSRSGFRKASLFFVGLTTLYLALDSPISTAAEGLFAAHEIQFLLLRIVVPVLLALSWPQLELIEGLPKSLHMHLWRVVPETSIAAWIMSLASNVVVSGVVFIALMYAWHVPALHQLAVQNVFVHRILHMTFILSGFAFWFGVLNRKAPRSTVDMDDSDNRWASRLQVWRRYGPAYGARLMMLWLVILSNILLGSYMALKSAPLYAAYGAGVRLSGYMPLADEQIGGIIIWIPSSLLCLIAILLVVHMWGLHEERLNGERLANPGSNSAALMYPTTGVGLIARARSKNRAMAAGFGLFALMVFATAILVAVLYTTKGFGTGG